MKYFFVAAIWCASASFLSAADSNPARKKTQEGRLSQATLLATARSAGKDGQPPDGMRFLILVTRKPEVSGNFTLKETRDFRVAGESYQDKSHAELGKRFEPSTVFDTAEGFFAKQPGARRLAPEDIKGGYILALTIGGAKLTPGETVEITVHVGFEKEVESFTFQAAVPPSGPPSKKA